MGRTRVQIAVGHPAERVWAMWADLGRWASFVDGIDPGHVLPLQQVSGGPGLPVASINGDCPVDDEDATWGGVKALYR